MKTLTVTMIHVRYSLLSGFAWLAFWGFLAYFLGALQGVWTHQWATAHWWWVASAVVITLQRPFKTVAITQLRLPVKPNTHSENARDKSNNTSSKP